MTEINQIKITDTQITLVNLVTGYVNTIEKNDLKGYQDTYNNGRRILLIDKSDQVVTIIHEKYYVNFNELAESLNLKYLGEISLKLRKNNIGSNNR